MPDLSFRASQKLAQYGFEKYCTISGIRRLQSEQERAACLSHEMGAGIGQGHGRLFALGDNSKP